VVVVVVVDTSCLDARVLLLTLLPNLRMVEQVDRERGVLSPSCEEALVVETLDEGVPPLAS